MDTTAIRCASYASVIQLVAKKKFAIKALVSASAGTVLQATAATSAM
jgi:hypothetical protein